MHSKLIMPSHIVIKDGLACGDRVTLLYDFEDDFMNFNMISNGCKCCELMCRHLQKVANGKQCSSITKICNDIERKLENGEKIEGIDDVIKANRLGCYMSPISILRECSMERTSGEGENREKINLYIDKLDCDACATRENVSWLYQKPRHIHGQYKISEKNRKILMRLGRLNIHDISHNEAMQLYESLGEDEFEFMEEYKLMPMVYQNLKKLDAIDLHDDRWRLLIYQYQRTIIAKSEIDKVNKFISDKKLEAYWVKGAFTKNLYEEPQMRNLTDFDLLVLNEVDAFTIISWLLENDFNIFPDSFSLKKTVQGDKENYTGHLHFQKIINLQFRLIIDVNFTGFPMIRVASYVPIASDQGLALESLIVVALCHLFKHKEVFLKDINDLFIMLSQNEYSLDILKKEIEKNGLAELFSVVLKFIKQEYVISDNSSMIYAVFDEYKELIDNVDLREWPYSDDDVRRIKTVFFEKYIKEHVDTQRLYLYPTLIFKKVISVDKFVNEIKQCEFDGKIIRMSQLTNMIYRIQIGYIFLIVTPVGIFLEMQENYEESMKTEIRKYLKRIVEVSGSEVMEIPYAIAFEEQWLDSLR